MDMMSMKDRQELLTEINSSANRKRKQESIYHLEVFKNKLDEHVKKYLSKYISEKGLAQMPIIDEIGMCERIIKQEASIYKEEPKREFLNVTEGQKEVLNKIYEDMKYNEKNKIHNRYFKLQHQALSYIVPKKGKLVKKNLLAHQYDVIPSVDDPEEAAGYVISSYNQPRDLEKQRYVVWTHEYNFIMDGRGVIITAPEDIGNPIAPLMPMSEASYDKDGDYYLDEKETCVDFTVLLNAVLTEILHVMRMQGFGQAVITGSANNIPKTEAIEIGLNSLIVLLSDGDDRINPDFKFVNANPDLAGSIEVLSTILSAYLSSKGIDPKSINFKGEGKSFSSGWERFLALIEKFEASKDDLAIFRNVEFNDFKIISAWHDRLIGDQEQLLPEYKSVELGSKVKLSVEFVKPEVIQTEPEKINATKAMEDNGYISHVQAVKRVHNLSDDKDAIEYIKKMNEHKNLKLLETVVDALKDKEAA